MKPECMMGVAFPGFLFWGRPCSLVCPLISGGVTLVELYFALLLEAL